MTKEEKSVIKAAKDWALDFYASAGMDSHENLVMAIVCLNRVEAKRKKARKAK